MPKPKQNESKDDFISRCMGDDEANSDFPDADQRRAFCESQWNEVHNMTGFEIKAKDKDATIYFYGPIGDEWGGVTDIEVAKELKALGNVKHIEARFNSDGGNVFQGMAIYNQMVQHPATITAYIDGLAASISSVIPLAADTIKMGEGATYMIHDPWMIAGGTSEDFRKAADILDMQRDNILNVYHKKTGLEIDDIKGLMAEETWMDTQKAVNLGFVDESTEGMKIAAKARSGIIKNYRKTPEFIEIIDSCDTVKEVTLEKYREQAIRAGIIKKEDRKEFPRLVASGEISAKLNARLRKRNL